MSSRRVWALSGVETPNENRDALVCVPVGALIDHHRERACPTSLNHWRGALHGQATLHNHHRERACPTSLNHWRGALHGQATLHDHCRHSIRSSWLFLCREIGGGRRSKSCRQRRLANCARPQSRRTLPPQSWWIPGRSPSLPRRIPSSAHVVMPIWHSAR